jgi:CBS domain containing-hemolysin-like protein
MIWEILLAAFLVFLNGFFVAAEFAIVKVRESQIELRVRSGSKTAKLAKKIIANLDTYLSATQLGITLASLGLGWIGEPVFAEIIKSVLALAGFSLSPETLHSISLPVAFVTITILHIVFGELAPKSLAIQRSEQVALVTSGPLIAFYWVFSPFIWILNTLANWILRLAGFQSVKESEQVHNADEIRYILKESQKSGLIGDEAQELINRIFEFTDKDVKQIMVPRGKIVAVESTMSFEEMTKVFINEGYTRLPVYDKEIDNVIGIINAKDLLTPFVNKQIVGPKDLMRTAYFVQESEFLKSVLKKLLANKVHIAMVLDEFDGLAGLITLEDIIEEIVGEIQDEYDDEQPSVKTENQNEFIIAANTSINDINQYLPVPLPESDDYETVAGLITSLTGRIPKTDEVINLEHYDCKILKRSERVIESVKLELKQTEQDEKENNTEK